MTSPFDGECGDGVPNVGDEASCPEDWGTPQEVVLSNQPSPQRDLYYEEPSGTYDYILGVSCPGDGGFDAVVDEHVSGDYGGETYYTEGSHILEENVAIGSETVMEEDGLDCAPVEGEVPEDWGYNIETNTERVWTGENATGGYTMCWDQDDISQTIYSDTLEDGDSYTLEGTVETTEYDSLGSYENKELTIEVSVTEPVQKNMLYECDETTKYGDDCSSDEEVDCSREDKTYYELKGGAANKFGPIENDGWVEVTRDDYSVYDTEDWGHVDHSPGMFDNVDGFSSSDVVNSGFGYHSDISRDSRQGSNDPAVSANSYVLRDGGGGWSSFEAHRTDSNVANADGPDGGGNGIIAYSEVSGVEGVSDGIFDSEYWDGGEADYISESDLPDINCPGDNSRCVASIDVMTRQSGWGSEPSESFTIDID